MGKIKGTDELLLLPKGIALTRQERIEMCRIIESALRQIYGIEGFYKGTLVVDGVEVFYEYMSKAVNNRLLLRKIVYDDRGDIKADIKTKEDLFAFVKENTRELLHPRGRYFPSVYSMLEAATRKGDLGEDKAFAHVEEIARKKGMQIQVLKPRDVEEDVYGGVDGFFTYNDRNFTLQVKPLSENIDPPIQDYKKDPGMLIAYFSGFTKQIKTDYLVLNDNRRQLCHLFKSRGIVVNSSHFLIPRENEVNA